MASEHDKEIDHISGVETTGHEWDGLKELNNPLPKWWLYTMYACTIWAIGYMIAYPAWPLIDGYTKGVLGHSQRASVMQQVDDAKTAQSQFRNLLDKTPLEKVKDNPELLRFAMAGGAAAFGNNCAPCHGRGAQGAAGYPNLNDDDWLWGGKIGDIHQTLLHGIRSGDDEARTNAMPNFGADELLDKKQINDVAEYVLSLTGKSTDKAAATAGKVIFDEQCAACHGEAGAGLQEMGGPRLNDAIWLYGGSKKDIVNQLTKAKLGVMPAWTGRLDSTTIKSLAVYVHSLGGGQ